MAGFHYFPHTDEDIRAMLDRIGVNSLDDLYADVPADCLYQGEYDLPDAMTEQQVRDFFEGLRSVTFLRDWPQRTLNSRSLPEPEPMTTILLR